MADSLGNRLHSLLGSDVYTARGRMRADDLLVRERVGRGLGEASARLRELAGRWRVERIPPSTREQPFPPASAMEPIRRADRLIRAIDDASAAVRGLPLLNQDKVWDRVRSVGLDELLQFDWTLVGEADALAVALADATDLAAVDAAGLEARLRQIRGVVADRRHYIELLA